MRQLYFIFSLILILSLAISFSTIAYELVIIQTVSQERHTFVLHKGKIDGISEGQESMFTSPKFSFIARASEVSRYYSVWQMPYDYTTVPFQKNEYVTMSNNKDAIWQSINTLSNQIDGLIKKTVDDEKYQITKDTFIFRGAISRAIKESISETNPYTTELRTGMQLEVFYENHFFKYFEMGIGIRYDSENAKNQEPALIIPTMRVMLLSELTYHFSPFKNSNKSNYGTIGGGVGKSNTTVGNLTKSGEVSVLPFARIGLLSPINKEMALIGEISAEAITMKEFSEDNSIQITNIINTKLSVGLRL